MIAADYQGELAGVLERLDLNGVQSVILEAEGERVLLIRGTDELCDWLYNLDFRAEPVSGENWSWHRGFYTHAQIAYAFAKGKGISLIIGHSLGAAAAGIVAVSLGLPALCFGTPRALHGCVVPPGAALIRNYCRLDDPVTMLPFEGLGYRHCGEVIRLVPPPPYLEHGIAHYLGLLADLVVDAVTPDQK